MRAPGSTAGRSIRLVVSRRPPSDLHRALTVGAEDGRSGRFQVRTRLPNINVTHIFNVMLKVPTPSSGRAAADERGILAEALLDELSRWGPRERAGMLRSWHRGSLSLVHLMVLNLVEADGPQSMGQLAEALDVSVASVTGIVDRMERRGLVERERGEVDRRRILVSLTPLGAGVFSEMSARRRERLTRLVGTLSDRQIRGLLEGIRAMHAAGERLFGREMPPGTIAAPAAATRAGAGEAAAVARPGPRPEGRQR